MDYRELQPAMIFEMENLKWAKISWCHTHIIRKMDMLLNSTWGKGWSDLPEELQDRFDDYSFDVVNHLDCTDEEIAYHMARCNRCAKMNANQKGILYMYKIAGYVKKLSQNHRFFFDCGNYTSTEKKKGSLLFFAGAGKKSYP